MTPSFCLFLAALTPLPQSSAPSSEVLGQPATTLDARIWCIHQDQSGALWFGSNGSGAYRYDGEALTHYTEADGLGSNALRDIEEDAAGHLFFSTSGGITKFDGTTFRTLKSIEVSPGDEGWALNPDDTWLISGIGTSGPYRYDGNQLFELRLPKSPMEEAFRARHPNSTYDPTGLYSLFRDHRGHVWFGTSSVGLCRFDGVDCSWMYEERLTTGPDGGAFCIRSIYEDRAGHFWICNTRQRFEMLLNAKLENGVSSLRYKSLPGVPEADTDTGRNFNYFSSILEDKDGALWMACGAAGVWKYDGELVTHYPLAEGSFAFTVHQARSGKIWAGTAEHGAYHFEEDHFDPFSLGVSAK